MTANRANAFAVDRALQLRGGMRRIALSWDDGRAIIAVLREKALPSMLEHTDHVERQLEQHAPEEPTVRLSLSDDLVLRSSTWARWQLGMPLPVD
jgi:hypothetical protein